MKHLSFDKQKMNYLLLNNTAYNRKFVFKEKLRIFPQ